MKYLSISGPSGRVANLKNFYAVTSPLLFILGTIPQNVLTCTRCSAYNLKWSLHTFTLTRYAIHSSAWFCTLSYRKLKAKCRRNGTKCINLRTLVTLGSLFKQYHILIMFLCGNTLAVQQQHQVSKLLNKNYSSIAWILSIWYILEPLDPLLICYYFHSFLYIKSLLKFSFCFKEDVYSWFWLDKSFLEYTIQTRRSDFFH